MRLTSSLASPWVRCIAVASVALASAACGGGELMAGAGSTGGGGGPVKPPARSEGEIVNGGQEAKSQHYRTVFTFGQPNQDQGTSASKSYKNRGGLIGTIAGSP